MERPIPSKSWYLVWGGKSVGPWTTETVLEHLADRKLKGTDRIIGEGESNWRELRDDPFFSTKIKRKPRRKERLQKPRSVSDLIQTRKKAPPPVVEEMSAALTTPPPKLIGARAKRKYMPLLIILGFSALLGIGLLSVPKTTPKKTRGPEELNPPNPPGPATTAPEESDPNLIPKPPTRPKRS